MGSKPGYCLASLESGQLALDKQTFRDMSRAYPQINPMRELRASLSELRLEARPWAMTDGTGVCSVRSGVVPGVTVPATPSLSLVLQPGFAI